LRRAWSTAICEKTCFSLRVPAPVAVPPYTPRLPDDPDDLKICPLRGSKTLPNILTQKHLTTGPTL
jgi:hypothetical protein